MLKKSKFCTAIFLSLFMLLALCSNAFAASVGQQLPVPEPGWQRIDDADPRLTYTGSWTSTSDSNSWAGTGIHAESSTSKLTFKFKGTKLRLISVNNQYRTTNTKVRLDGVEYTFNPQTSSTIYYVINFEKIGLEDTQHTVEMYSPSAANASAIQIDAIDIDDTGYIINPDLSIPLQLSAVGEDSQVALSWHSVSGATLYNIKRSYSVSGPYTTIASNVAGTTYRDIDVTNGITYYYVVTAVNASGESANSNEASATPQIPAPSAPINLAATTSYGQAALTWEYSEGATAYTVLRSTYSGGPYTAIASVISSTYTNIGLENGKIYYYVVQAVNGGGISSYSNEAVAVLPSLHPVLVIVNAEDKVRVGQEFTSNIVLKNVAGIYAEDFTIQYDDMLFEFLGFEEIPGYKVYHAINHSNGTLRFVVASQGADYGINSETIFLKLKFKAKAVGIGKVDAIKARIANTSAEFDLEAANCLEDIVIVENQDVNKSGEYTLLDLAIDAAYYGELGSSVDPTKYVANQVGDDTIRDEDLVFIVSQILSNTNYVPNHNS